MHQIDSNPPTFVLRLQPGDDLRAELQSTFSELQGTGCRAACVISAVGSLSRAVLRYAAQPQGAVQDEALELVTLSGTLSPDGPHLHACVADALGQMRGGHVMPGCRVRTTAEIVLVLLPGWAFSRAHDAGTGFMELQVERMPSGKIS
ncbi:MAG: PPC domain-containing DNA-binding protein [Polaromonas sp.]